MEKEYYLVHSEDGNESDFLIQIPNLNKEIIEFEVDCPYENKSISLVYRIDSVLSNVRRQNKIKNIYYLFIPIYMLIVSIIGLLIIDNGVGYMVLVFIIGLPIFGLSFFKGIDPEPQNNLILAERHSFDEDLYHCYHYIKIKSQLL